MPSRDLFANMQGGAPYKFGSDVNNQATLRGVYGGAAGATLGQAGSAMTPNSLNGTFSEDPSTSDNPVQGAAAPSGGTFSSPIVWLVVLALLLVGFRFLAKKGGEGGQYANVHVTIWNVILITLVAILGLATAKVVFSKINVPGLSTLVHAA